MYRDKGIDEWVRRWSMATWNNIIQTCANINRGSAKPLIEVEDEWVISYQNMGIIIPAGSKMSSIM